MTTGHLARTRTTLTPTLGTAAVISIAIAVALGLWALAQLLGIDLTVTNGPEPTTVGAPGVALATLVAGLVGRAVHMLLGRRRRTARWWPFVGTTGLAVSVIGPSYLADGAAAVALISMHVAVGAIVVLGFARLVPR